MNRQRRTNSDDAKQLARITVVESGEPPIRADEVGVKELAHGCCVTPLPWSGISHYRPLGGANVTAGGMAIARTFHKDGSFR